MTDDDYLVPAVSLKHPPESPQFCYKKAYPSEAAANEALREIAKQRDTRKHRRERRAYSCDRCGHWHLTSRPSRSDDGRPIDAIASDVP